MLEFVIFHIGQQIATSVYGLCNFCCKCWIKSLMISLHVSIESPTATCRSFKSSESASSGLKHNSNKQSYIFSMVSPYCPPEIMVYYHPSRKTWITTPTAAVSLGDDTLLLMICLRRLLWTMMAWHRGAPWDMGMVHTNDNHVWDSSKAWLCCYWDSLAM